MLLDIVLTIHFILLIVISLRVLSRYSLSPQARMAWIVVLFLLPYLGVVVYWLFGEVHLGWHFNRNFKRILERLYLPHKDVLGSSELLKDHLPNKYHPAFKFSGNITKFRATTGNQAVLMKDAADTNRHILADFESATDHIHVLYYIWLVDGTGSNFADALIRAAKRGVTCRVMVDGMGSRKFIGSKLWREMEAAGVQLSVARPIRPIIKVLLFSRMDLRNHRKITIIDGKVTYIGSRNCADPEFRVKAKYAPWVDIMMRVTGPVVAQNQLLFASDWLMENPETPADSFTYVTDQAEDGFLAKIFADGPNMQSSTTPQFLNALLVHAEHSLIISTPYFVPNFTLVNSLCATAQRGVEVTMIFPKRNDSLIVAATSHSYYWQLLKAGVKIYEYKPGLLHAKTLTIDGEVSLIGSTNLDMRSFDLNYENNIVLYDKTLTQQIIERQQQYIKESELVMLDDIDNWSLPYRIWNNVIATMGPVL